MATAIFRVVLLYSIVLLDIAGSLTCTIGKSRPFADLASDTNGVIDQIKIQHKTSSNDLFVILIMLQIPHIYFNEIRR
jgi:hypothetical protein